MENYTLKFCPNCGHEKHSSPMIVDDVLICDYIWDADNESDTKPNSSEETSSSSSSIFYGLGKGLGALLLQGMIERRILIGAVLVLALFHVTFSVVLIYRSFGGGS